MNPAADIRGRGQPYFQVVLRLGISKRPCHWREAFVTWSHHVQSIKRVSHRDERGRPTQRNLGRFNPGSGD